MNVSQTCGVLIYLIVPGTALLTDAYGLMGLGSGPYSLLRWSVAAKICRCRLAFISVGAGPFFSSAGKFMIKSVLSLADFRSYRDEFTVGHLQRIGIPSERDRVLPDLVFSLSKSAVSPRDSTMGAGAVIGLGVMNHAGRYGKQNPDDPAQVTYLQALLETAKWLLARGYNIRLLIGDFADAPAKQAFLQLLAQDPTIYGPDRIIDEPIHSVEDLLRQIAETDAVIATRFHNIILSIICEKPVISISFHHKCDLLMTAMGMSDYCLSIADLERDRLIETFCRLEVNADDTKGSDQGEDQELPRCLGATIPACSKRHAKWVSDNLCPDRSGAQNTNDCVKVNAKYGRRKANRPAQTLKRRRSPDRCFLR